MTTITPNSNIKEKGILLNTMVQVVFLYNTELPTKTNLYVLTNSCSLLLCISFILNCTAKISKIFEICKSLRNYFTNYFIILSLSVFTALSGRVVIGLILSAIHQNKLLITITHQPMLSIKFVIIPIET